MGGGDSEKPPRHVAVAIVYDAESHKVLMVSSRAHPGMWICELTSSTEAMVWPDFNQCPRAE